MIRAAFLLLIVATVRLGAQIVERPVPFDSAAKVRVLTPALVTRFDLKPPVWPVEGDFAEARLYAVSTGGTVLAVERSDGRIERHALDDAQVAALREAIDNAMASRTGGVVAERSTEPPDVSRGAFVRNQMILSAILYGPLIATFADDGNTGTALYLLSVGGSYFFVNSVSKNTRVTPVQNDLATDGAIRGYTAVTGLLYAVTGDDINRKTHSTIGLAGALGGSVLGYTYGRRLTDSEAQSARKASTLAAATTMGVLLATGAVHGPGAERGAIPAIVAGGAIGYVVGPLYPKRVGYTVTAADVRLLPLGALLGFGVGATPFIEREDDSQVLWTSATLGIVGGVWLADRLWVRPYDHSHADATQTWLGAIAGTLMGGAVSILSRPIDASPVLGILTGGAFLGALAGHAIAKPAAARPRGAPASGGEQSLRLGRAELRIEPANLALIGAGVPGRHSLLSIRF